MVDELRITAERERFFPVRLERVRLPDAVHRAARHAGLRGHRRGIARLGGGGEGNMLVRCGDAHGRVIATPAGTGQVDLGPGVQFVDLSQRFDVAVAADES
ncbi:MAG: hypothetical protein WD534_02995 [Phycisphaeraceae bacterium]